jgi:hypothetical protein
MRYDSRVDENQSGLIQAARDMGASVLLLHRVGNSTPDILIGYHGIDQLVEVKTVKGELSDGQAKFIREWNGRKVKVARTVHDIIGIVLAMG